MHSKMLGIAKSSLPNSQNLKSGKYFEIGHDYLEILKSLQVDIVIKNGCFIGHKSILSKNLLLVATESTLYKMPVNGFQFSKNKLVDNHHLILGKIRIFNILDRLGSSDANLLTAFKNKIIDLQLSWSYRFLKIISDYLKTRSRGDEPFVQDNQINPLLAEAAQYLEVATILKQNMESSFIEDKSSYQLSITHEIKKANHLLAKLSGSRAFLSGNMLEMILVFEYFQDIYFNLPS